MFKNRIKSRMSPIVFSFVFLLCVDVACAQSPALEPVTIQLRWFHQFQFAGYYTAIEKGFYAAEGLRVSLREFAPDTGWVAPVLEGKVQYGVGGPGLLKLRAEGAPVVVLAQTFQHSPEILLTLRESGIFSPYELVGKNVMYPLEDTGSAPVQAMFLETLGGLDRVTVIPHSYNYEDLQKGKVDAMTGYLSNEPLRLKQKGVEVNIIDPRSYGIDFYGDNLFTTEKEIAEHPERVEKVIRATLKGWAYALEHKDEIIDLIQKKYNPMLSRDQLVYEAKVIDQMIMPDLVPIGEINFRRYERSAETYHRLGMSTTSAVPQGFIYKKTPEPTVKLTPEERAWLKAHPNIRLGYVDSHEPQVIVNPDGTHSGIVVDLLEGLNRRLGTAFRLEVYPIKTLINKAKSKGIDGICNLHPEYADSLGMLKSQGYFLNYPTIFARSNVAFKNPGDFAGKTVAIIDKAYFSEKIIRPYADRITVRKVKSALEGLKSLERGDADLFIGISHNTYLISKYQLFDIFSKYVYTDYSDRVVIAIRSDWSTLVNIVNKGLSTFSDAELNAIVAKWVQLPRQKEVIALTSEERAWLEQHHTVRVRVSEQAPYMYSKDGSPSGIIVDLLNVVSERTGVKFHFVIPSPLFSVDLQGLIQHTGPDLLGSLTPTPEREKKILFTKPYISSPKFIFTRDDAEFVASMENLNGKSVAVIKAYLVHKELEKNYPDINLVFCKNNREALTAVSSGKAFAFIGSMIATPFMINEYGLNNLKASAPSALRDATVAMATRNDWPELRDILNKVFDGMPGSEKAALINKWSSIKVEYGIRPGDVLKWALVVGVIGSGIVLLFVFWNRSLAKQVLKRTSELAESEERFRATFEQAAVGIAHVSPEGRFLRLNQKFCDIVGYSCEEMLQRTFQDITHPNDLKTDIEQVNQLMSGESNTYITEKRYIRKNGELTWIHLTFSLVRNEAGEPQWFVSVVKDINERRQTEQKLQDYQQRLKALASQLTIAEEKERRTLASDLHDHVGHSLALARMQLNGILEAQSELERNMLVKDISHILLKSLQDTRSLIFELSSPLLNEMGLGAAISEYLEEYIGGRYGLKKEFIDEIDEKLRKTLDDNVRAMLFRNVRELLTNVIKHAKAEKVSVHLKAEDGMVTVIVEDDGIGFDPQAATPPGEEKGGFGLFSIEERMTDLGGTFDIRSEPGKGCRAVLTVPVEIEKD